VLDHPVQLVSADLDGASVAEHGERLAVDVGDRDAWSGGEILGLRGQAAGRERPRTVQEVTVHGADPGLAVEGDGGRGDDLHAGQQAGDLGRGQGAFVADDAAQVLGGLRMGGVEQVLQPIDAVSGEAEHDDRHLHHAEGRHQAQAPATLFDRDLAPSLLPLLPRTTCK
jgi:hypothetical protein